MKGQVPVVLWKIAGDKSERVTQFVAPSHEIFTAGLVHYKDEFYAFFNFYEGQAYFMLTGGIVHAERYLA